MEAGRVLPFSEEERKAVQTGSHFETEASYLLSQEGLQTGSALDFKPGAKLLAQTERAQTGDAAAAPPEPEETAL